MQTGFEAAIYCTREGGKSMDFIGDESGPDAGTVKRIQNGMLLFDNQIDAIKGGDVLGSAFNKLRGAALKGFCLQWYKAMGGGDHVTDIADESAEELRSRAESQTTRNAAKIEGEMSDLIGGLYTAAGAGIATRTPLALATLLYAQNDEFREYPELAGACAAARQRLSEQASPGTKENLVMAITAILAVTAVIASGAALVAGSATVAVCAALGAGVICSLIAAMIAKCFAPSANNLDSDEDADEDEDVDLTLA
jgi:hypothetical protein